MGAKPHGRARPQPTDVSSFAGLVGQCLSSHPVSAVVWGIMITLTPSAAVKVKQLLETENASDLALRVAVRPGGCSGYSYEMYFDGDFTAEDKVEAFGDVKVVVDPASAQLLAGASLDYTDGLNESGFKITNPNANRTCGCGQSFS